MNFIVVTFVSLHIFYCCSYPSHVHFVNVPVIGGNVVIVYLVIAIGFVVVALVVVVAVVGYCPVAFCLAINILLLQFAGFTAIFRVTPHSFPQRLCGYTEPRASSYLLLFSSSLTARPLTANFIGFGPFD